MKRVVIIHGWEANRNANWFPWLASELPARGIDCDVPNMPDSGHPKKDAWVRMIASIVGDSEAETILVGHSLGCIAILQYLQSLPASKQIRGAILVSGFDGPVGFPEVDDFAVPPIDHARVMRTVREGILVVHSDNDPVVSVDLGRGLRDRLSARYLEIHQGEHLNMGSRGDFTFPELVTEIERMFQEKKA